MTCFGSKALHSRIPKTHTLLENSQMPGEDNLAKQGERKKGKNRRPRKEHFGFHGDCPTKGPSERSPDQIVKARKSSKHQNASVVQTSMLRKQVDPETAKYFSEIGNLFESIGVDLEERSVICGNALEETRGKELELATDYIISHTLQTLLEGSDVDHLCDFLQGCANEFPFIAMDKSGSHVAETALKSLAVFIQDRESYSVIESTLTKICQVMVLNPVCVMCSRYGSHVLRSLLCLCKGIPLDSSEEFHVTKSSTILAERLNLRAPQSGGNKPPQLQEGFPDLLRYLVAEMLKCAQEDIATLLVDKYSSFVLQTALKLLAGEDQELMHVIPVLLGCHEQNVVKGNFIETTVVQDIVGMLKDTAYSHLMEVILGVAPEILYNEIFTKVFKDSLFEISSDHCGSFVVQALISSTRCQGQMELIWEELGPKFKELFEIGRSGVIASLLAASQRLRIHGNECCQALAAAVCSGPPGSESPSCIVPRILFLESYFCCEDKFNWKWVKGDKMHVLGCLMLQTVFRYPSEFIQPFVTSITSMEVDHVLEAAKDTGGGRVVEAFLSSDVSTKQKRKLLLKLRGHFGELSMHPSGSFTVEKCFTASNMSVREMIVSELFTVRAELSKTKQGPHLLRKLDVDGFATRPDQWRSRQASKQTAYKEFCDVFGPSKTKSTINYSFLAESGTSHAHSVKKMRKEIEQSLASPAAPSLGFSTLKCRQEKAEEGSKKFARHDTVDIAFKGKSKERKKKNKFVETKNAALAGKKAENAGEIQGLPQLLSVKEKKRHWEDGPSKSLVKLKS